ncbi:MAG: transposase [Thermoplasmatales archaeon]|nr:transposase [Thermoplasmatales archaeon]
MSGEIKFSICFRYCKEHGSFDESLVSLVNRICPPGRNFDSKVMVAIGILRWFFDYQREEIKTLLLSREIHISTGEISNLSEEFLLRFYALHKRHVPQIKALFEKKGGIKLHLDGTGETGNEIVFMAKEGETGITMDAQIIPTENKKYVTAFLQTLKSQYDTPIVVVRDMSKQIRDAVTEVYSGVQQQICHYHFVNNLGKLIFKERYAAFRKRIVKMQILSQLKKMKEKIATMACLASENVIVVAERKWITLAIEHLLISRERSSNYPFVLPYFEIMNRILEVKNMNRRIIEWNKSHNFDICEITEFSKKLDAITSNTDVNTQYTNIKKMWTWFEKVRITLRVGRHLSQNGSDTTPTNAQKMKVDMDTLLTEIDNEGEASGGELLRAAKQITKNCRQHTNELFVEVKDNFGNVVEIMRDNNIEERSHRWSRMHIRRRTGRTRTTNEMAQYGALTAIFSNIENETYIKEILPNVKDFIREIQDITPEEIQRSRKLIRPYACKEMIHSDTKRSNILKEFIDLLEDGYPVENWLSKLNIS